MVEYYDYKELESVKATSPNVLYYKFVEMFNENRPFYAQCLDSAIEASEETKFSIAQAVNIWASVMSRATQPVFYIQYRLSWALLKFFIFLCILFFSITNIARLFFLSPWD